MNVRDFITEVLDTLRNMEDASDVICELDADAVIEQMEIEVILESEEKQK